MGFDGTWWFTFGQFGVSFGWFLVVSVVLDGFWWFLGWFIKVS